MLYTGTAFQEKEYPRVIIDEIISFEKQETRRKAIAARMKLYQLIKRRRGLELCHKMNLNTSFSKFSLTHQSHGDIR